MGTPTAASPAPTFQSVIEHGVNGYLADAAEWPEVFRMVLHESARQKAAVSKKALATVESNYTGQAVAPRIEHALSQLSS